MRFIDISSGTNDSTVLHFTAPRFGEVAEEVYQQGQLYDTLPLQTDSAFDVMSDMIEDVAARDRNSDRFDLGVLRRIEGFKEPVLHHGVDDIVCFGGRIEADNPPTINTTLTEAAVSLYQETPGPERVRIVGHLDMIRVSDKVFTLNLKDGQRVRGIWLGESIDQLRSHWNQDVVVNGSVEYRPSGTVLRLEADSLNIAKAVDSIFSKLPSPVTFGTQRPNVFYPQNAGANMKSVFGRWPGDETDEEVLRTLAEVG